MKGFGNIPHSKRDKLIRNKQTVNKDQLIKQAFGLQAQGRKLEAAKCYEYIIKKGINTIEFFLIMESFLTRSESTKKQNQNLKKL